MQRSTRGQIQIGETLAVIIVFIILLIMGLAWWSAAQSGVSSTEIGEEQRLALLEKVKEVRSLSEVSCAIAEKEDTVCLDLYKLRALQKQLSVTSNDLYTPIQDRFRNQFFSYTVQVDTLYPNNELLEEDFTLFNYAPVVGDASNTQSIAIPMVVYDAVLEKYHFSLLTITQETGEIA